MSSTFTVLPHGALKKQRTLKNLGKVNILLGRNGAGKSALLRAINKQDPEVSHYINPERGGPIAINPTTLNNELEPQSRQNTRSDNQNQDYNKQSANRVQAYFIARGLPDDVPYKSTPGKNEIESKLSDLIPGFKVEIERGGNNVKVIDPNGYSQMSSGERNLIGMCMDIFSILSIWKVEIKSKSMLLIDEPDAHLHPDFCFTFANFILENTDDSNTQILIATHSNLLASIVGRLFGEDCRIFFMDDNDTIYGKRFDKYFKEISTLFNGTSFVGQLIGTNILLVEGNDDYRIWARVPRHKKFDFSVLPCDGKPELDKCQRLLEDTFKALSTEIAVKGYALIDGDQTLPTQRYDFIKYIRLECKAAENLYFTEEVLSSISDSTFDEVKKMLKEKSIGISKEERLNYDFKKIIIEVSQKVDKYSHWTERVGKAIGKGEIKGELLEFLGNELVESLLSDPD